MRLARSLAIVLGTMLAASAPAQAPWPAKPIRLVSPFPPGAVVDTLSRTIAAPMGEILGQAVVVENKPGAGGNIGMDAVAKSAPDGYTIGMGGIAPNAINPGLYAQMPYDAARDFAPITFVARNINVLVVHPAVPAHDVRELVAYARANAGKLSYGSAGAGTSQHLAGELFKQLTGVEMTHVPYKGAGPAVADLLAGQIQLMFADISAVLAHVRAGKLRALGVTSRARSPLLDVPTIAEQGVADFDVNAWFGLVAPAGTPRDIVLRLNDAATRALRMPAVVGRLEALGLTPAPGTPEEFGALIRSEIARWGSIVKRAHLRAE
jgi:tripartite-type tricarboxylate transporter receptor subunit TctC